MTATMPPVTAGPTPDPLPRRIASWWSTVRVLIGLEVRLRLRTTRWKITLAVAFLALSAVVFGSLFVVLNTDGDYQDWAPNLYAVVMGILMFIGVILAPTLTATAINGDRKDATLAVVQATPISNWQITIGKLLGNWVCCLALVVVASPYLVWAILAAPYGIWRGLLGIIVLALLLICYCGIGLGISAMTARPAGSAVLTQATVFFLILGLPAVFGILYTTTAQDHTVLRADRYSVSSESDRRDFRCVDVVRTYEYHHTERIWWLLAPNPFLVVPDAVAPADNPPRSSWMSNGEPDPTALSSVAWLLSSARSGPYIAEPRCADDSSWASVYERREIHERSHIGDSWWIGLLISGALGSLGLVAAARRLRVPATKLPKGVRIA